MKTLLQCAVLALLMLSTLPLIAQDKIVKKANLLYENKRYGDAIPYLEKAIQHTNSLSLKAKLANAYKFTNQVEKAEATYSSIIMEDHLPDNIYLQYAEVLVMSGKYDVAKDWLRTYLTENPTDKFALQLYQSCDAVRNVRPYFEEVQLTTFAHNTANDESCPLLTPEGLYFSSDRPSKDGVFNTKSGWTGRELIKLYFAKRKPDGTWAKPKKASRRLNALNKNIGGISLSRDGREIYFARNNTEMSRNNTLNMQLYKAEAKKRGSRWRNVRKLEFCNKEHNYMHPSISPDGRFLYFVSDKGGGEGDMDIWVSERNANDEWSRPVNLGAVINTPQHEAFPFAGEDEKLFFCSKGREGLGGFDIFVAERDSNGTWLPALNVGAPINSSYDDVSLYLQPDERSGAFASTRQQSNDDIYFFDSKIIQKDFNIQPITTQPDAETLSTTPVTTPDARVQVSNPANDLAPADTPAANTTPTTPVLRYREEDFIVKEKKDD